MKRFCVSGSRDNFFGGYDFEIKSTPPNDSVKGNSNLWIKLIMGAIIGFVNGFWGGGGGMICVPLLTQIIKLPEKKAHATTLLIMLPLSIISLVIYIIKGNIVWIDALKVGGGFVLGGVVGAYLLKVISNVWLSIVFSMVIIAGGVKMLL